LLSILRTCPIHCHLLFFTMVLIFSSPAPFLASLMVIFSGQYIFRMLLMHLWRKVSKIFSSPFVIFQVSLPYSRTDRPFDLRRFILVFLPNWLLFHTDLNLLYANLAWPSLLGETSCKYVHFTVFMNCWLLSIVDFLWL
jgi:hypothetical protein